MAAPRNHLVNRTHADNLASSMRHLGHDTPPFELLSRFSSTQKLAREIDSYDRVPLLQRHLVKRSVNLEARVVNEDVYGGEFGQHTLEHPLDLRLLGDIGL